MLSLASKFKRHLKTGRTVRLNNPVLQTWWIIEKCAESPESDRTFCGVAGVLKQQEKDLKRPYKQSRVLVLTENIDSKKGIVLSGRSRSPLVGSVLSLSPIDYKYEVFPGWD